jgi:CoA:oxalate CoA-transferase
MTVSDDATLPNVTGIPAGLRLDLLSGVRVLDLTRFLAGPFAGMILGDLGAEVIKVEQMTGDSTRTNPPHFFQGDSAYFLAINRNKRSIALNLRAAEGRAVLHDLVAASDVILDNLRAPQRQALGLSFDVLRKINPAIVSVSVTGFGSDGPYEDRPAYDIIVEALAGVMSLTGPVGGPSVRAGVPIGDITAGLYAVIAVQAGIEQRRRTGEGTHLDVAMLDCQVALLSYLAQYYFISGVAPSHQGREHVSIPTYNTFVAADGIEIVVAANTQEMWCSLCKVLGRADLIDDPRFPTNADRLRHKAEVVTLLQAEIATWTARDLHNALMLAGVPVAPINTVDVALQDPQIRHRQMVVTSPHHAGGTFPTLGVPVKADTGTGTAFLSPPALGQHSLDLLLELGYSAEQARELDRQGFIRLADTAGQTTSEQLAQTAEPDQT